MSEELKVIEIEVDLLETIKSIPKGVDLTSAVLHIRLEPKYEEEMNAFHKQLEDMQSKYDFILNECKDMETKLEVAREVLIKIADPNDDDYPMILAKDALDEIERIGKLSLSENIGNLRKERDKSDDESKYWEG